MLCLNTHRLLLGPTRTCLVAGFQTAVPLQNILTRTNEFWNPPRCRRRNETHCRCFCFGTESSTSDDEFTNKPKLSNSINNFVFYIDTPDDMEDLGGLLATLAVFPPTVLFLDGDLGAGKTALARGYLRTATANPHLLVTSPTYLLSNVYATTGASQSRIYHMDLYRLDQKETVEEIRDVLRPLDLDSVFANNVVLMEWPERLGPSFLQRCNNAITTPDCSAAQDNSSNNNSNNPSLWPCLPVERLEIDIRIRQQRKQQQHSPMAVGAAEAAQEDEMMLQDVQSRVVTLTPVGSQWRQALQEAVDDGLVDDFLFPDDDDDDDESE